MVPTSTTATARTTENISATLSHGGSFIQYNIFEVTAKYKPPILPIVKGAYGIVCSALNAETNEHVALKKIANVFDNKIDAKRTLREIKLFIVVDSDFLNYWRLELLFGCIVQLVLHIIFELLAS